MRALGRQREQHAPLPEAEPRAQLALGLGGSAARGGRARAARRRSARGDAQQLDQVARGRLRSRRSPAASAAPRPGRARACPAPADPSAPRGSACRSGRGSSPRAGTRPYSGAVLAQASARGRHPARAASRGSSCCSPRTHSTRLRALTGTVTRRYQLAPRPAGRGRLAVDEGGEARTVGARREQRRDQLARGDLHPAGLAGDEEDQVQADVARIAHARERALVGGVACPARRPPR